MIGRSSDELREEFASISRRNERVQKPVAHISLSPSPTEQVSDETMLTLVSEYMDRLGFGECQWVVAKHSDTETSDGDPRPHYHIIANRVKLTDNKVVSEWMDWSRTEKILRDLEKEFGMVEVASSWEVERSAPSTGQQRRKRREKVEYEAGFRSSPPDEPIKVQIQRGVDQAALNNLTMPQLMVRLQEEWGITAKIGVTRTGKIKGISYSKDEVHLSGTQLGKAYTFAGLQKYRGISYIPERDDEAIKGFDGRALEYGKSPASIKPTEESGKPTDVGSVPSERSALRSSASLSHSLLVDSRSRQQQIHFVANTLSLYLNSLGKNEVEGKKYIGRWKDSRLTLYEKVQSQEPREILKVGYNSQNSRWVEIVSRLREQHIRDFQEIDKELKLREKANPAKGSSRKKESPTLE